MKKTRKKKRILVRLRTRLPHRRGSSLAEYTSLLAIVSVAGVVMLAGIGMRVASLLQSFSNLFPK